MFAGRVKGPTGWWLPGRVEQSDRVRRNGRLGLGAWSLNVIPRRLTVSLDEEKPSFFSKLGSE